MFQFTKHLTPKLNRSRYLLAGLALKQNEPSIALNLVPENNSYVTVRYLRLLAFTQSGRFEQACNILRQNIDKYNVNRNGNKPYLGTQMVCDSILLKLLSSNDMKIKI